MSKENKNDQTKSDEITDDEKAVICFYYCYICHEYV